MIGRTVSVAIVAVMALTVIWIFWRYPDFRRAFIDYCRPGNVAKRMNDWAGRNRR